MSTVAVLKAHTHERVSFGACSGKTLLPADIVPDYNRDGKIDSSDKGKVTQSNPWHWWINDSQTSGDIAGNGDQIPGSGTPNYSDQIINGTEDLENWFPLSLEIKQLLNVLPSTNYTYELRSSDSSMNMVIPSEWDPGIGLSESNTQCFFTSTNDAETLASPGVGIQIVVPLTAGSNQSADLPDSFLSEIQSNGYGMILIEGSKATVSGTTSNLELHVISKSSGQDVAKVTFPMQLSGVEKMYRWVNLRHVAGQTETRPTDTSEPTNYPDSLTNGKMFVFVHGYNVNEQQSRAWCAEAFKRLYQQGSNAMFTGVSWHGDYSQIPGVLLSPDYWANAVNAFNTSQALASAVNGLNGSSKTIAAHSLGNMVVSYAIQKRGMHVSSYFLLDAAVAMEAYDSSVIDRTDMENPAWDGYATRLWASDWYELFGSSDGRSALTWRGLLNNIGNAFNFYSSGEDVLDNTTNGQYNSSLNPLSQTAEHAWITQELAKGTTLQLEGAPINRQGGWGFELYYEHLDRTEFSPAETTAITNAQLETIPFFLAFQDAALFDPNQGSAEAQKYSVWTSTISYGVPALSFATGRNPVNAFGQAQNFDLMNFENGWPQARLNDQDDKNRWFHGDAKDIAYPFNYPLWKQWVQLGSLK
jgi:hypothetical protein